MFWGVSPALDLQEEYLKSGDSNAHELNFLIIGGCDARHVLKTLAQSYKHERRYINLFVIDGCPELVARQILLLTTAFEKTSRCGLLEKTRRYLELYGNLLLRPSTSRYFIAKSRQLINMITNPKDMNLLLPCMTLEHMKYREKDYMENLLSFWTTANTNQFNACELWESRLRQTLGIRYDSRFGVYDWDLHMRLKDIASQICATEYKHFREHGVAFTWLETEVGRPNISLTAGVSKCGERFLHRGYLGDLVTSPYIAYGLSCEDQDMLKSNHGQNFKRATDVSERNVMRLFYELENRQKFDPEALNIKDDKNLGMVILANIDAKQSEQGPEAPLSLCEDENTYIDIDNGKIHFLSLSALEHYPNKVQFQGLFDALFIGNNMLSSITPNVWIMAKDDALIIMESRKYLAQLTRDDIKKHGQQMLDIAKEAQCEIISKFDPEQDDFAKFLVKRKSKNEDVSVE